MAFQPKGGFPNPNSSSRPLPGLNSPTSDSLDGLVDQIADAVRERLIRQGVPLAPGTAASAPRGNGSHWQHLLSEGAALNRHRRCDQRSEPWNSREVQPLIAFAADRTALRLSRKIRIRSSASRCDRA